MGEHPLRRTHDGSSDRALTHHVELILFPGGNNRLRESSINEMMTRTARRQEVHNG